MYTPLDLTTGFTLTCVPLSNLLITPLSGALCETMTWLSAALVICEPHKWNISLRPVSCAPILYSWCLSEPGCCCLQWCCLHSSVVCSSCPGWTHVPIPLEVPVAVWVSIVLQCLPRGRMPACPGGCLYHPQWTVQNGMAVPTATLKCYIYSVFSPTLTEIFAYMVVWHVIRALSLTRDVLYVFWYFLVLVNFPFKSL